MLRLSSLRRLHAALVVLACVAAPVAHAAPESHGFVSHTTALGRHVRDSTSELVMSAVNFLGVPYKRGGNDSALGFDCSGFTRHVYESTLGLLLPRKADEQAKAPGFQPVQRDELKPGDLVFFNTLRRTFSHVGIYIGEGKFIHAPRPGGEVRVENMGVKYWAKRFTGARRATQVASVEPSTAAPAVPAFQRGALGEIAELQWSHRAGEFDSP